MFDVVIQPRLPYTPDVFVDSFMVNAIFLIANVSPYLTSTLKLKFLMI